VDARRRRGQAGEAQAAAFLERRGFRIIARNVRFPEGEIDLVCRDGPVVVFVEVKCRRAGWDDTPAAAVSWQKRRRLARLALHYLKRHGLADARCRFDVVAVSLEDEGATAIRHIPSAFDTDGW
jgi:putative endonuclease